MVNRQIKILLLIGLLGLSFSTLAAVDMYLKIGDIKGESSDKGHKDEIDVLAWSWGASSSGVTGDRQLAGRHPQGRHPQGRHPQGRHPQGKDVPGELQISIMADKSSAVLTQACNTGKHFKAVTIKQRNDKEGRRYMRYKLTDVMVTRCSTGSSSGGDRPTENITLNSAKVDWAYNKQKAKAHKKGNAETTWKVEKGEK
jgi:type VI secretion system secreted protein Hcp